MDWVDLPPWWFQENDLKDPLKKTPDGRLLFYDYDIADIIGKHGSNLKVYFPEAIGEAIIYINALFRKAMETQGYDREKTVIPTYVTKTNHDAFVLRETVKSGMGIETSAPFDIEIIKALLDEWSITKDIIIPHNGYKSYPYMLWIFQLIEMGFKNSITIFDDVEEAFRFQTLLWRKWLAQKEIKIWIRVAAKEDEDSNNGISALWVWPNQVLPLVKDMLLHQESHISNLCLTVLHSFLNLWIKVDESTKAHFRGLAQMYCDIYKLYQKNGKTPTIDTINIGGWMPVWWEIGESIDYYAIITNIVSSIKEVCEINGIPHPHIMTEFGTFTVWNSGIDIFNVAGVKDQGNGNQILMLDTSIETRMIDIKLIKRKFPWYSILYDVDGNIVSNTGKQVATIIKWASCDKDDAYPQSGTIQMPAITTDIGDIKLIAWKTHPYANNLTGGNRSHAVLTHCQTEKPKEIIVTKQHPLWQALVIDPKIETVRNEFVAKLLALGYRVDPNNKDIWNLSTASTMMQEAVKPVRLRWKSDYAGIKKMHWVK